MDLNQARLADLFLAAYAAAENQATEVLGGLPELLRADDLTDAKDHLIRSGEQQLAELAAAARRLDRLCKAELKQRSTPQ